jgi:hypothetical protein
MLWMSRRCNSRLGVQAAEAAIGAPIVERRRGLVDGKRAVEIEVNAAVAAPEFASQLDPLSPIADLAELRDQLAG